MLTVPRQKFCDAIVSGLKATDAYAAAYPCASRSSSATLAGRLLALEPIQAEIARLRAAAEETAGSAILTLAEKRSLVAKIARAKDGVVDGCQVRASDKLKAIVLDNLLAGVDKKSDAPDTLEELLREIRQ